MRTISIAVGSMMVAASFVAFAQDSNGRDTGNWTRQTVADQARECWNQNAGHYEAVRPGERQNDLDFNRCHYIGESSRDEKRWNSGRQECWNPRAGHFEAVRNGEHQDDLDFSRCRNIRED
ncbi:MAG: hypothetical protein WA190_13970 [Usitatibacter sp.]